MAFVVVEHTDPAAKGLLPSISTQHTARCPVS